MKKRKQVDQQLYSQLYLQLDSQLNSQLREQLYWQLRGQLYWRQLYSKLDSQLYSQLRSQKLEYFTPTYCINLWYWASYYGFYDFVLNEIKLFIIEHGSDPRFVGPVEVLMERLTGKKNAADSGTPT